MKCGSTNDGHPLAYRYIQLNPLLDLPFLSHGHATLKIVDESLRFYREFLGLDVLKTSKRTLFARLGSNMAIVGATIGEKGLAKAQRSCLQYAHFGFDMPTAKGANEARELAREHQESFHIQNVGDLMEKRTFIHAARPERQLLGIP